MKLFMVARTDRVKWDENRAVLVRAVDEDQARFLAAEAARDEGGAAWKHADCEVVEEDRKAEVIMVDYMRA